MGSKIIRTAAELATVKVKNTTGATVAIDQPFRANGRVYVALEQIANNAEGMAQHTCVVRLTKDDADAAFATGEACFWDGAVKKVIKSGRAPGNFQFGYAYEASPATTQKYVDVLIDLPVGGEETFEADVTADATDDTNNYVTITLPVARSNYAVIDAFVVASTGVCRQGTVTNPTTTTLRVTEASLASGEKVYVRLRRID